MAEVWLSAHGEGPIQPEFQDELRELLIIDLADRGAGHAIIEQEVEQFLRNGRISSTNLSRLRRRVERRSGSQSARFETASAAGISELSQGPLSARGLTPAKGGANSAPTPGWRQQMSVVPEGEDVSTWSGVAKHAMLLEELEKQSKKEVKKSQQELIRTELLQQMAFKKERKNELQSEELRVFQHQKAEIERFEATEKRKKDMLKSRIIEMNKERDDHCALKARMKDEEQRAKKEEDKKLVKKAAWDLAREQEDAREKKIKMKAQMAALVQEYDSHNPHKQTEKQQRLEEERRKVQEYNDLLAEQEARNKPAIRQAREGFGVVPESVRRGYEFYSEENLTKQLSNAIALKDEADSRKEATQRCARQNNQDFLVQQIEERNRQRRQNESQKSEQRRAVQAASEAFFEAERDRIEQQRLKNIKHREDLENQILVRKNMKKESGNAMTAAEKAINRHLIGEARELREKVSKIMAEGVV